MSRLLFFAFETSSATASDSTPYAGLLANIQSFKTGSYSVTRSSAGAYVNGRYAFGAQIAFSMDAVVEPFGGHELKVLPEGQLAEDVRVIYTAIALFTITPTTTPDQIAIEGDTYTVFRVDGPWQMSGRSSYRVYAARQRVP